MLTDLASRLKRWKSEYEHIEYGYHSSEAAAYRSDATLHHRHGGKEELDNDKHPP